MPPIDCAQNGTPARRATAVSPSVKRRVARSSAVVEARRFGERKRREARGHRHRIAGERPRLVDGTERRDLLHDARRPPKAPTGMPPPMTLPSVVRSGVMPYSACAPPACTRKPVITSSKIEHAPCASHSARRPSRKPGARRDQVHVAGDRLDDDGGDLVALRGEQRLDRREVVVRQRRASAPATAGGTPADDGCPNVSAPEPAFTSRLSPWP